MNRLSNTSKTLTFKIFDPAPVGKFKWIFFFLTPLGFSFSISFILFSYLYSKFRIKYFFNEVSLPRTAIFLELVFEFIFSHYPPPNAALRKTTSPTDIDQLTNVFLLMAFNISMIKYAEMN